MQKKTRQTQFKPHFLIIAIFLIGNLCCSDGLTKYSQEEFLIQLNNSLKKYKIDAKLTLTGKTLYIYVPLKKIFIESQKNKSNFVYYNIKELSGRYADKAFVFDFNINKLPEAQKEYQNYDFDKDSLAVIRKISAESSQKLLSSKAQIDFIVEIYANVIDGYEMVDTIYTLDLKKLYCGALPYEEYANRIVRDFNQSQNILQDFDGKHIEYRDIDIGEFIAKQINQRIKHRLQVPSATRSELDKELRKIVKSVLGIYAFNDFLTVEMNDLASGKIEMISRNEIFEKH